ncbi:division/cell wall cluster transcriptional repressor MraZ [Candidatus Dojkabacteria bacterium]|nr:division/cell wall cluster transcriptional repressor MraZ [Candidatus Dojkabacteria bacterium]
MIIGQYKSKVGEKNRVAFPKQFRNEMGDKLIVTRGYEGCLIAVDQKRWEVITKEITQGTFIDRKIRDAGRFLLAGAHEVDLDTQGRFVVPKGLVEFSGLSKEAVFLGLVNWVEIWSDEQWREHEEYVKENGEDIAQEIAEVIRGQQE